MTVVDGDDGAVERATGVSTTGKAEVKIWVLEAEMWVMVVVEVEVQVVVTNTVAARAEAARKRERRIGWRIVVGVFVARESFDGALWLLI